jgi:hypothetical protein
MDQGLMSFLVLLTLYVVPMIVFNVISLRRNANFWVLFKCNIGNVVLGGVTVFLWFLIEDDGLSQLFGSYIIGGVCFLIILFSFVFVAVISPKGHIKQTFALISEKLTPNKLFLLSLALFVLAAHPNFLIAREWVAGAYVDLRYDYATMGRHIDPDTYMEIYDIGTNPIKIGNATLTFKNTPTGMFEKKDESWESENAREIVQVDIYLDGKKITKPGKVILGHEAGQHLYWNFIDLFAVTDKKSNTTDAVLIEKMYDEASWLNNAAKWKIIRIHSDGTYDEEEMTYEKRSDHLLYVRLINMGVLHGMSMGYFSDIMEGYPTLFFPIFYPWGLNLLCGFVVFAAIVMKIRRKNRTAKQA